MKKFIFVLFLVFTLPYWVNGQCTGTVLTVNNPSFEGTPEAHVTPPGWDICMPGDTPDTQPGFWGQNLPPSNGSSYIGLVYEPSTGWQEGAGQTLSSPMVAGTTYNFTIDLAVPASADPATGIIVPPYCAQLQLWGGMSGVNSGCDQAELLWTSPVISNSTWQTYALTFTPTQNWDHVLFLISSTTPPCTDGQYLMMDNMTPIIPQADVAEFGWTPSPNICAGSSVSFNDSSASTDGTIVSWAWNFGDGGTSTVQNPTHIFVNPGTYNVSLTIVSTVPCTTNIVHQVDVYEIPTVVVPSNVNVCTGTVVAVGTLSSSTAGATFQWTNSNTSIGLAASGSGDVPSFTAVNNGISPVVSTITVTPTANGCTGTPSSYTITANPLSVVTVLPNNPFICTGNNIQLFAGGATDYEWQPTAGLSSGSGANVVASPVSTTTYTVYGFSNGCSGSAMVTVNVFNVPVMGIVPVPGDGCSPLEVTFSFFPAGPVDTNTLSWNFDDIGSPDNSSVLTHPSHTFVNYGSYSIYLSALTANGCPVFATDTVYAYKKPVADFYTHPEVGYEDNPKIDFVDISVGAYTWLWNFGDPASLNANYANIQNPFHVYTDTGIYTVQLIVSTSQNCSDTIEKPVIIYPSILIYIPNAFTPDNDQWNDIWKPVITGIDEDKYQLYVFDRWGKILFYTEDINEGWDGKNKGKPCQKGVYVYMVVY